MSDFDAGVAGGRAADIDFYFNPVCPFAWMTSKWVRLVQAERNYTVDWRFISLRLINSAVDYDAQFPAAYEAGHTAGLRLLRVAARARASTAGPLSARCMPRSAQGSSTPWLTSTRIAAMAATAVRGSS